MTGLRSFSLFVLVLAFVGCSSNPKRNRAEAERYFRFGLTLRAAGNYTEAARNFAIAANLDPSFARAHMELGVEFLRGGVRLEEAVERFRRALAEDKNLWQARHYLVDALRQLGRIDEAIEEQKILVSQRPYSPEVNNNLGYLYLKDKRFEEAVKWFQKAIDLNPNYELAWAGLGTALWRSGRIKQGVEALRKAVTLRPREVPLRLELARALIAAGRTKAARKEAELARSLERKNGLVYHVLAEIAAQEGNKEEARAFARHALLLGCPITEELRRKMEFSPEEIREGVQK